MDTLSSGSEEEIVEAHTSLIKEIFAKWMDVKNFVENTTPTKPKQIVVALSGMTRHCHIFETS